MLPRPQLGSWGADGKFQPDYQCNLVESAAKTATFTSDVYEMGSCTQARLTLDVTVVSGTTPTLDVVIQTSPDNSAWTTAFNGFGQVSAVGSQYREIPCAGRYIRAVCTIGGTNPSFTMSLTGRAV